MQMETIRTILGIIQRNYNKHHLWAEESRIDWYQALQRYDDKEVEQAVRAIVRTRKTLPNVAAVIDFIQANRKATDLTHASGCNACDQTGWREVVRWYSSRGSLVVDSFLAACDCPKGSQLAGGAVPPWEALVSNFRSDPFTEAVYHSTSTQPHLTREQRLHPDVMERIKNSSTKPSAGAWRHLTGVR